MEHCLLHESAPAHDPQTIAVVGLGNLLHGDDAVGLIVAQSVFGILRRKLNIELVEWPVWDARLAERLVGCQRAVIIDALIDPQARIGTVVSRVGVAEHSGAPPVSLHTAGFQDVLALAQMVGMPVPDTVRIYGIAIREPRRFSQGLSPELAAEVPGIARAIAREEMRSARRPGLRAPCRA